MCQMSQIRSPTKQNKKNMQLNKSVIFFFKVNALISNLIDFISYYDKYFTFPLFPHIYDNKNVYITMSK